MSASPEITPYIEQPWIAASGEFAAVQVNERTTRIAPASYDRQVQEVLASHTGSRETYLSVEQEQELATLIQTGQTAQAEREELEAQIAAGPDMSSGQQESYFGLLARVRAGRNAERTLVECNLKLSAYLARASMNILPKGDQEAIAKDGKAGVRRRALLNDRLSWLPADFTSLKSQHAVLDDRIQVANLGLMRAARTFTPGMRSQSGKLIPFLAFATPVIKTELARYVTRAERPIHVPANVVEDIAKAGRDDWQEEFTPKRREDLRGFDNMQDLVPLDELYFAGAANEEVDREGDDAPLLWAGEVIPSYESTDPAREMIDNQLSGRIEEILQTLSEREAGVIRLRFGLDDGQPRTLDEIGLVYGIGRERVRQIEAKTMGKLRHPARSEPLRDFLDVEDGGEQPMRSGDVVKAKRSIGRSTLRLMLVPAEVEARQPSGDRASWQAYPGESWEEPVRKTPTQLGAEYASTASRLKDLLFGASLYTFQKSFAEDVHSPYPKILVDRIVETFGRELTPAHLADFWNNHLEPFLQHLTDQLGDDASPERATQLLSRLLAERMTDNDEVSLRIPESLQGKLGYVGAWLSHGKLCVFGNLGDYAGHEMSSLGHLQIEGSVAHFAGSRMKGNARLEIDGNGGDFLGFGIGGQASILVNGDVGSYCGHRMKAGTKIEVMGGAGGSLGFDASGGEIVVGRADNPHHAR